MREKTGRMLPANLPGHLPGQGRFFMPCGRSKTFGYSDRKLCGYSNLQVATCGCPLYQTGGKDRPSNIGSKSVSSR